MPLHAEENPAQYDAPCVAPCPGFIGIIFTPLAQGWPSVEMLNNNKLKSPCFMQLRGEQPLRSFLFQVLYQHPDIMRRQLIAAKIRIQLVAVYLVAAAMPLH